MHFQIDVSRADMLMKCQDWIKSHEFPRFFVARPLTLPMLIVPFPCQRLNQSLPPATDAG